MQNRPVGSERLNLNGYTDVKIAFPSVWKPKHHVIWEAANGPVPEGHQIMFADGNKSNFALDNLLLVSFKELSLMNRFGLVFPDSELTKTGKAIAGLNLLASRRKRGLKKGGA
jgi:hypothetical protein